MPVFAALSTQFQSRNAGILPRQVAGDQPAGRGSQQITSPRRFPPMRHTLRHYSSGVDIRAPAESQDSFVLRGKTPGFAPKSRYDSRSPARQKKPSRARPRRSHATSPATVLLSFELG